MAKAWVERNRYAAWVERLERSVEIRDGRITDLRAQLQQAQRKGTAAWLLFERRCDELRQAIERAERAEALLARHHFQLLHCPLCYPAEALAQRGAGDEPKRC